MSIVRVGLAETEKFADGYEAIFGKKPRSAETPSARRRKSATRMAKSPKNKKRKK